MTQDDSQNTVPVVIEAKDAPAMATGNQLTPIAGSNGFQQQIAFDLSQPLDLSITNVNGEVKVKASDEQTIWLVVRSNKRQPDEPINLTVAVDGNKISIHPDWQLSSSLAGLARKIKDQLKNGLEPGDWNLSKLRFGDDFDYDIRVEVPRGLVEGSKVSLRTTSGAIDVDGLRTNVSGASASGSINARDLQGQVSLHTASGSVHADQIHGSLEINTASGSIKVNGGEAWTALRTVSGSIKVEDFVMKNAKVASVSGSIRATFLANNNAPYSFDTVSGSVHLTTTFPAGDEGPTLTFRSVSGSANADGEWISTGKRTWRIGNGGGAQFRANTVSGSLRASGRRDASVVARNEPMPNSDRYDTEQPTEEVHHHQGHHDFGHDIHHDHGHGFGHNIETDEISKAVNWAKEAARRFTQPVEPPSPPTPPTPPAPATPAPPATPASPATAVTPPAPPMNPFVPEVDAPATEAQTAPSQVTQTPAPAPQPQVATTEGERPEDEEALKVLEALERGDIDVEEALARIERAEHPTP
jgi:hypothetical protein